MTKVVNLFKEPYDIYIGRPSEWGNPFTHKSQTAAEHRVKDRETSIRAFREYAATKHRLQPGWLEPLRGKTLGCFCKPKDCHGDVIVELLDGN